MTEYIYVQGDSMYVERYIKERVEKEHKQTTYIHPYTCAPTHIYDHVHIYNCCCSFDRFGSKGARPSGWRVAP